MHILYRFGSFGIVLVGLVKGPTALMYLQSTSLTHGHSSPYLGAGTWVLTFGVLANGSKMICQPLGQLLGPGSSHMGLANV